MTRHSPARLLASCVFVVLLSSCAGSGTPVAPAAAEAQGGDLGSPAGNPGGPGGSGDEAGTDVPQGGNPGAPGDVAVFEEAGVPHSVLRDDAANKCADGVCTLLEPVATVGNPDDVGGLDECIIQQQSDIHYEPPAKDGLFRKGATVQADVDCTADESTTDGTDGTDTSGGEASPNAHEGQE